MAYLLRWNCIDHHLKLAVHCCLLCTQLPAWPFVSASFGVGVFALLPYFAFWRPAKDQTLPPKKEELVGGVDGVLCG
jgi:hypothetical protein